jgi:phosphoribosylglycinamide formyltransferase 1
MKIAYITTDEERYLRALQDFDIKIVISNNKESQVIDFCRKREINYVVIDHKDFGNRKDHDAAVMNKLDEFNLDLVILGGYRRLIKNKEFLNKYGDKIINVHNSFLPNFPGSKPHEQVFSAGISKSGYTIHFVDEVMDRGEIIFQEEVDISDCKSSQEVYDKLVESGCGGLKRVVGGFAEEKILKHLISRNS